MPINSLFSVGTTIAIRFGSPKQRTNTTMNTYQTITSVTPEQVAARINRAAARIDAALGSMCDRYCRRHKDGVNELDDMDQLPEWPVVTPLPAPFTSQFNCSGPHKSTDRHTVSCCNATLGNVKIASNLTPTQLADLIAALDSYGDQCQVADAEYRTATVARVAAHVAAQADAARRLAGLVAAA